MDSANLSGWAELVKDLGFPIAVALILMGGFSILLFFSIRVVKWLGTEIIVPLRDSHISFLRGMVQTQARHATTLDSINDNLGRLTTLQEQHSTETGYIRKLLEGKNEQHP